MGTKSLLQTKTVEVSPPSQHRTTNPCTFTERQKAFVGPREHDHIASDLFNIHESDREMKPDVYVSKAAHVEGFPKSFEKIGGTISGQNRLSLTNIYYYVEKLNCIIVLI